MERNVLNRCRSCNIQPDSPKSKKLLIPCIKG